MSRRASSHAVFKVSQQRRIGVGEDDDLANLGYAMITRDLTRFGETVLQHRDDILMLTSADQASTWARGSK